MMDKQYFPDPKQNADFIRCANFMLEMIQKYGPAVDTENEKKEKAM